MTQYRCTLFLAAAVLAAIGTLLFLKNPSQAVTYTFTTQPVNATVCNSAQGANAQQVATLTGKSGQYSYIEGFTITASGATSASVINVTVGGTTNTLNYAYTIVSGATTACTTLDVRFPTPIPSSATNTNITVTMPSAGSGNTNQAVTAYGFTAP